MEERAGGGRKREHCVSRKEQNRESQVSRTEEYEAKTDFEEGCVSDTQSSAWKEREKAEFP